MTTSSNNTLNSSSTLIDVFAGHSTRAVSPELGLSAHIDCTGNLEVTARPPAHKLLGKITSSVEYLKRFRLNLSCSLSIAYLTSLVEGLDILQLYRHYFPVEFAASTTSLFPVLNSHRIEEGVGIYSPREIEFFGLVNEHLFPIDMDAMFSDAWDGIRPDIIPLEYWSHGFEIEDPDLSGSRLGWQVLASIFYYDVIPNTEEAAPYARALGKIDKDFNLNFNLLADLCNAEGTPKELEYLPAAIEVLHHETGNTFIDYDDMYPADDLYWSDGQGTIDRLADEHVSAHEILDKCELLMDWIEASPKNFRKVIELCNQSNSKRQERLKVRV